MAELAKPYHYEKELAFFVARVGMSRKEFDQLTETEKMFIRKEHENKFVEDTTWIRNAVLNGTVNANRKKNKKFVELFPKKQSRADIEYNENAMKTVLKMEKEKGKGWVDKIYQKLKMTSPKKGGN
ncbi:phenylalanine racemase [Salipaludibacillus sp. HK11]|uniref:phenylalanine racemase n=1 Tax=Salipaludibacillus sp. HK11 TaxID=3394320 RepID=UPI0039FC4AA4